MTMTPLSSSSSLGASSTSSKLHKNSHVISKSSSTTTSTSSSITTTSHSQRQQHPLIVYTHSPKVIHTNAADFMALVQKLTGLSHSSENDVVQADDRSGSYSAAQEISNKESNVVDVDDDLSTSSENFGGVLDERHGSNSSLASLGYENVEQLQSLETFLQSEMLGFGNQAIAATMTTTEFLCSPASFFPTGVPGNVGGSTPAMEAMKSYYEY